RGGPLVPALALLGALALLLPGLGTAPLDDPGEGQHAEIAREVGSTGSAATLRLNGVRYFDKPPLLYWLTAGSFRIAGPTEWAARLAPVAGGGGGGGGPGGGGGGGVGPRGGRGGGGGGGWSRLLGGVRPGPRPAGPRR